MDAQRREGPRKKLIAAAQHWATGEKPAKNADGLTDDLKVLGVSSSQLSTPGWAEAAEEDRAGERERTDEFPVWRENWETLQVFLALSSNWRTLVFPDGTIRYQGIEYSAIKTAMWGLEVPRKRRREVFAGLRVMEEAALISLSPNRRKANAGE